LPDVQGDRAIRDFLLAVEPVSPNWALTWRVEFDKHDWASDHVILIYRLVEIYRNYRRLETAQQENRAQFSANAVTFKGEPADDPKPKPESSKEDSRKEPKEPCVCGGRHPYYICWYLNEVNRPS